MPMKKLQIAKLITWVLGFLLYFVTIVLYWAKHSHEMAMLVFFLPNFLCMLPAAVGVVLLQSCHASSRNSGHVVSVFAVWSLMSFACLMAQTTEYFALLTCSAACLTASYILGIVESAHNKTENPVTSKAGNVAKNKATPMLTSDTERVTRIRELKQLLDDGILTYEEFAEKKTEILGMTPKDPPV